MQTWEIKNNRQERVPYDAEVTEDAPLEILCTINDTYLEQATQAKQE